MRTAITRMLLGTTVLLCALFLAGCGLTGSSNNKNSGRTLVNITISGPNTVAPNSSITLTGIGHFSDGTSDGNPQDFMEAYTATWSSSVPSAESVTNTTSSSTSVQTTVTAIPGQSGPSTISLTFAAGGSTFTATQIVTIDPSLGLVSILVTPATPSLSLGASQQLTATGTYNNGTNSNVTNAVTWSSSNAADVSVTTSGAVMGVADGNASVTASIGNIQGTAFISVHAPSGGLVLNTNLTDSLILAGADSSGSQVSYFGTRDPNGVPQYIYAVSSKQADGSRQTAQFDQNHQVTSAYDTRGFNYTFAWSSKTRGVVKLSTNDGTATISTSFDLSPPTSLSVVAPAVSGQAGKQAFASEQNSMSEPASAAADPFPRTQASKIAVVSGCSPFVVETHAMVTADVTTASGNSQFYQAINNHDGNYYALLASPTTATLNAVAIATQAAAAQQAAGAVCQSPLLENVVNFCDTLENVIKLIPPAEGIPWISFVTDVCVAGIDPISKICNAAPTIDSWLDLYVSAPITIGVEVRLGPVLKSDSQSATTAGPFPFFSEILPCPNVDHVSVSPGSPTIAQGASQLLDAIAWDIVHRQISSDAINFTWSVDKSDIATVVPDPSPAFYQHEFSSATGQSAGSAVATATDSFSSKSGTSNLTVQPCSLTGAWQGSFASSDGSGSGAIFASFVQTGTSFTGTISVAGTSGSGAVPVSGTTISGKVIFGPVSVGTETDFASGNFQGCSVILGSFVSVDSKDGLAVGVFSVSKSQ